MTTRCWDQETRSVKWPFTRKWSSDKKCVVDMDLAHCELCFWCAKYEMPITHPSGIPA